MARIRTDTGRTVSLTNHVNEYWREIDGRFTRKADDWLQTLSEKLTTERSQDIHATLDHAADEIEALIAFCQRLDAHAEDLGDRTSQDYQKLIEEWIAAREAKWSELGGSAGAGMKMALNAVKKVLFGL